MEKRKKNGQPKLRELLTKKPFTRIMGDGHYDHGEAYNEVMEIAPVYDRVRRRIVTQEDFARELDPCGHLINDKEYYPDVWRQAADGRWYKEEIPRFAFAFQYVILHNQLTHLTGNDIQFEMSDRKNTRTAQDTFNAFKQGWADKNMEVAWFQLAKSVKATGDGAFVGFLDKGKFGWKVLSFQNGDKLYPHYDLKSGRLTTLARTYCNYAEDGHVTRRYIDVWDDTFYYRFSDGREPQEKAERTKSAATRLFNADGYVCEEKEPHGFDTIPVAYHRDDNGACWSFSQESIDNYEVAFSRLAQNNHDFGLPIMYVKGEGSQEVTNEDMSYAVKCIFLPSDGEAGFLNKQDASDAYNAELAMLEAQIWQQSFVVKTPELKSGDLPAAAIKLLYTPAYNKAMSDANEFDGTIDKMVEIFMFGYGVEAERRMEFANTSISHYIKPYIHLNETELTTNLATAVQNGFLSRQTASEKFQMATPLEWMRIVAEKKSEQEQEVLLTQQKLEVQSEVTVGQQEQLSQISLGQTEAEAKIEAEAQRAQEEEDAREQTQTIGKSTRRVSTARGSGSAGNGTYSAPGYDKWGNRLGENNWTQWNNSH